MNQTWSEYVILCRNFSKDLGVLSIFFFFVCLFDRLIGFFYRGVSVLI